MSIHSERILALQRLDIRTIGNGDPQGYSQFSLMSADSMVGCSCDDTV